jgi:hypothetical protein
MPSSKEKSPLFHDTSDKDLSYLTISEKAISWKKILTIATVKGFVFLIIINLTAWILRYFEFVSLSSIIIVTPIYLAIFYWLLSTIDLSIRSSPSINFAFSKITRSTPKPISFDKLFKRGISRLIVGLVLIGFS